MPCWTEDHPRFATVKLLVVGAGGIGCELLKNLAATGFRNVHVIDLDTIDVSNLNRQFLFRKEHVSSSKAEIATRVIKQFCPTINLTFDHSSIFEQKFNVSFFKQFDLVLNALDNKKARNHVNRMCHASHRPLIESGTAGYYGQCIIIMRGKTACYECEEKGVQKTFPGCTIRNTPSEHIHCTVWSKHVFNQLFGEVDIDDDVSPDLTAVDTENPEASSAAAKDDEAANEPAPIGTRKWAESVDFDAEKVFDKLFLQDIQYLIKMDHLWKDRKPPTALSFSTASSGEEGESVSLSDALKANTSIWSLATCAKVFSECIQKLKEESRVEGILSFEKDHPVIMAFVAACANVRAHLFSIAKKSLFDIKAMAGNIIPAIASTNAIIAGMIVTEAVKIIEGNEDKAMNSNIRTVPTSKGQIFLDEQPVKPNPKCYVCCEKPEVIVYVNPAEMSVGALRDKVLIEELKMVAPDVIDVTTNHVVLDSEDTTSKVLTKKLADIHIEDGAILACDDFEQDMELKVFIRSSNQLKGDEFDISKEDDEEENKEVVMEEEKQAEKQDDVEKKKEDEDRRKRKVDEEPKDLSDEPDLKRTRIEAQTGVFGIEVME